MSEPQGDIEKTEKIRYGIETPDSVGAKESNETGHALDLAFNRIVALINERGYSPWHGRLRKILSDLYNPIAERASCYEGQLVDRERELITQGPSESEQTGLAPCPFCGATSIDIENNKSGNEWGFCETCSAEGPVAKSYTEAIEKWNKRVPLISTPTQTATDSVRETETEADREARLLGVTEQKLANRLHVHGHSEKTKTL